MSANHLIRLLPVLALLAVRPAAAEELLFEETFEDTAFAARGWYDNPQIEITDTERTGGRSACVWDWKKTGDTVCEGRGGRVLFPASDSVFLTYQVKHSADWTWTGRGWHPHEFLFMTTADQPAWGPAHTHLTLYIEAIDRKAVLGIQDGLNMDQQRVRQDLTAITEFRAVAGGNGDSDSYKGDCYAIGTDAGQVYRNGKNWKTAEDWFTADPASPRYQGNWHQVRAFFKLNGLRDGKGVADGVLRLWYDGKLVIEHTDVMMRTGANPGMKINQFLMLPYYGPGVPHPQKIWIDDIRITR